ncbi:putative tail protein [Serratia phage vB_SmaS_Opt-169]|uniref:Putative tail protein n=1 Tax=Serratia phage vB_SmaS_Rovert TaxID=2777363 RepID=A0A7T3N9R1_9CAUD|nr:putative tail protein [Serratia phage vB_SmaS_Rovert]QPX74985.1 putative tail protein [Serratia phage vB_SmaS_Rovert]QPX75431.1 putative tail protein [Serratia phage vB_SmaS_Opt-169]UGO51958.1 putative tail tip complex protein [Serratia phage vB_SmaS_PhooPhighters]
MADNNLMRIESDSLEQTASVILFEVDLTPIGGDVHRFHGGLNQLAGAVKWQGITYDPFVTNIEGISFTNQGPSGRPIFTVANITGIITGMVIQYNELVGAIVYVREVYAKFLDADNFVNGNENADPNQQYISMYEIEKLNQLDEDFASFELCLPSESDNAYIPVQVIMSENCQFEYRGEGCRYAGSAYFDDKDNPVTSIDQDRCGKRLNSCKLRFGENNSLPARIYPSCSKVQS